MFFHQVRNDGRADSGHQLGLFSRWLAALPKVSADFGSVTPSLFNRRIQGTRDRELAAARNTMEKFHALAQAQQMTVVKFLEAL